MINTKLRLRSFPLLLLYIFVKLCTVSVVQYIAYSTECQLWPSSGLTTDTVLSLVAGMTRMEAEQSDAPSDGDRNSSSSPSSSSPCRSSVSYSVLVSLVSGILITSLPSLVQSHKQCSHHYPRDHQVSINIFTPCEYSVKTSAHNK